MPPRRRVAVPLPPLPDDIIVHIYDFCDPATKVALRLVCSAWHRLLAAWITHMWVDGPLLNCMTQVPPLLDQRPALRYLSLFMTGTPPRDAVLPPPAAHLPRLEELELQYGDICFGSLALHITETRRPRTLTFVGETSSSAVLLLEAAASDLQALNTQDTYGYTSWPVFPRLERLRAVYPAHIDTPRLFPALRHACLAIQNHAHLRLPPTLESLAVVYRGDLHYVWDCGAQVYPALRWMSLTTVGSWPMWLPTQLPALRFLAVDTLWDWMSRYAPTVQRLIFAAWHDTTPRQVWPHVEAVLLDRAIDTFFALHPDSRKTRPDLDWAASTPALRELYLPRVACRDRFAAAFVLRFLQTHFPTVQRFYLWDRNWKPEHWIARDPWPSQFLRVPESVFDAFRAQPQ